MGVKGTRLSAIAKLWAKEIHQDVELVASILWRYARGDYHGNEEIHGLRSALSGPVGPVPSESSIEEKVATVGGKELTVIIPVPGPESFLEPGIIETLKSHDPLIDHVSLSQFLATQGIAIPLSLKLMCETADAESADSAALTEENRAPQVMASVPARLAKFASKYHIELDGQSKDVKARKGLYFIAKLLSSPHKIFTPEELDLTVNPDNQHSVDLRGQKQIRDRINKNIKDARGALENEFPDFAQHLHASLRLGKQCSYRPKKAIHWDIKLD